MPFLKVEPVTFGYPISNIRSILPRAGLEPARQCDPTQDFKSCASTSFATGAFWTIKSDRWREICQLVTALGAKIGDNSIKKLLQIGLLTLDDGCILGLIGKQVHAVLMDAIK